MEGEGSRIQNARIQQSAATSHASRLTRNPSTSHVSHYTFYLLSLLFFALGLMCKPALVTLPFVLLLMDFWPLRRLEWTRVLRQAAQALNLRRSPAGRRMRLRCSKRSRPAEVGSSGPRIDSVRWLILEKLPLLVLAAASCLTTTAAHQELRILRASNMPLEWRIENAVVSYVRYLGKTVWPEHLAVFYPHPGAWPAVAVTGSLLVLVASAGWCCGRRAARPIWLLAGFGFWECWCR